MGGRVGGRVEGVAAVLLSSVHLYIFPRNSFFLITGHKSDDTKNRQFCVATAEYE